MPPSSSSLTQAVAHPSRTAHSPRICLLGSRRRPLHVTAKHCSPIYAGPGKGLLPGLLGSLPKLHVWSWMMWSPRRRSRMSRPCSRKRESPLPFCQRLDLVGLLPLLSRAGVPVGWSLATSSGALWRARSLSSLLAPSRRLVHSMPLAHGNRAGLDALVHAVQARRAHDPNLTVVSLDASAAYDGISRQSILQELRSLLAAAAALLAFAGLWLGRPSSFVWHQGATTRHLRQAEGVEQGDPLSPALFCLGLQRALTDLQRDLREDLGERVLAYFDDVTILAAPERVLHLVRRFEHHLAHCSSHSPAPQCGQDRQSGTALALPGRLGGALVGYACVVRGPCPGAFITWHTPARRVDRQWPAVVGRLPNCR